MKLVVDKENKMSSIPPRSMTIAGSDSGGGAGIQADLKTFTALQVYSSCIVTALTSQNTVEVNGIHPVPEDFVEQQLSTVLEDIGTDSVKTGMLFNSGIVKAVAKTLKKYNVEKIVVDPVMVASSGAKLLSEDTINSIRDDLLPMAYVITPNIPETEVLTEMKIENVEDMKDAAKKLCEMGVKYALVKGGHLAFNAKGEVAKSGEDAEFLIDVLYDGKDYYEERSDYIHTNNTHGTGCSLSAAIAAGLAKNENVITAYRKARDYLHNTIKYSFDIGKGHGPLNHFYGLSYSPDGRSFVQILKDSCKEEWDKYVNHEFVNRIADGTLPIESFKYFLCQDYIYLTHYARVHSIASFKEKTLTKVAEAANIISSINRETQLHIKYCESLGISFEELEKTKEATGNMAYTRFCIEKGLSGDMLDLRVALLPCLIGYGEIGMRIFNDPKTKRENNIYWNWIKNYAGDMYQGDVREGKKLIEELAPKFIPAGNTERLQELCETFRQVTLLEINFFDMGLNMLK